MSCLFDSLSLFVEDDSYTIRQKICDYLIDDPILVDTLKLSNIITEDKNIYVENMRLTSTCGGAIEIRSFTKVYGHNVLVKSIPNHREIEFIEDPDFSFVVISWNGGHYEPIKHI